MKKIPNLLTVFRILGSLVLLCLDYKSGLFVGLYLFCGLTDVLDGFLARKMKIASDFGARLDSIADFFMTAVILITLLVSGVVTGGYWAVIILVFLLRMINLLIAGIRFRCFAVIHTVGNKITGLLIFFCPLSFLMGSIVLIITCVCAVLSALEETLILLTEKKLDVNRKSIATR
ncbi:MAG: hypothetical protein BGN88_12120 [Clostridiales bacterium 43-6]|nr:MAG: hypothetical protein BGN88_12120 [Clostridiales bacterium 43-6]